MCLIYYFYVLDLKSKLSELDWPIMFFMLRKYLWCISVVKYSKPLIVRFFFFIYSCFSLVDNDNRRDYFFFFLLFYSFIPFKLFALKKGWFWHLISLNCWCLSRQLCHMAAKQKMLVPLLAFIKGDGVFWSEYSQPSPYRTFHVHDHGEESTSTRDKYEMTSSMEIKESGMNNNFR